MAWISLGKLVLFVSGLLYLGSRWLHNCDDHELQSVRSVRVILLILAAFAVSLIWSGAAPGNALLAFVKHSKLLEIALLISLIRNSRETRTALLAFLTGQAILIASSWAMAAGIPVPWATSQWATLPEMKTVVFSTYLDQSLIFCASAAVFWHLRHYWSTTSWLAGSLALAALINTLFLQEGRTGYLAALTVITLAVMWELPRKLRLVAVVLTPIMVLASVYVGSTKMQERIDQAVHESKNYSARDATSSSSGFRLNAWRRSVQAIMQSPINGHGVGSWTLSVKKIEGADAAKVFGERLNSNPHQEYLLWGVELGIGGIVLLLLLIASLARDAMAFEAPVKRATLSVVAVMAVACLFNSSLYDALIGDFFCITLGLLMALGIRGGSSDRDKAMARQTAKNSA
ncbi:O-antigen ligase family protein [Rhodoferax sp.]|uniref:O-antigen ligase family protein n=1 Tax=Rhodoferax sp. TaxID=50421 RepID=UPI00261D747E|nr:O-antigen ligase family protein [Rhodoferax sp.]MDD2920319.1 O-antigen ligase family protein [Rhodoferax sp.]